MQLVCSRLRLLLVLLLILFTGTRQYVVDEQGNKTSGTAIIAMGNINVLDPEDSKRFIAHGLSVIYNSVLCYIAFYNLYHKVHIPPILN